MTGPVPVVEARDLRVHFEKRRWGRVYRSIRAVDGVSIAVGRGETVGVAGESGCGKSTLARALVQIVPPTSGRIYLEGQDTAGFGRERLRRLRRTMQMVFQDPNDSLNPRVKIGTTLDEALMVAKVAAGERLYRVGDLLETVGLSRGFAARYPHELSGGQRQRVGLARALAVNPKIIICDEPVSSLDVSVQAQVVNLLRRLQREFQLAYLFIAHDLAVLRHLSDRVVIMYLGKIVEQAPSALLYARPLHPYTQALLVSVPSPDPNVNRARLRIRLRGEPPDPADPPSGCAFHPRCPLATERCRRETPALRELGDGHLVACHYPQEHAWRKGEPLDAV